jgi:hypothetical protein
LVVAVAKGIKAVVSANSSAFGERAFNNLGTNLDGKILEMAPVVGAVSESRQLGEG